MNVNSSNAVQILLLIGGLTLVPAVLFTVTGFSRILIVLGFIRTAIGHDQRAAQPGARRDRAVPDDLRDVADDQRDQEDGDRTARRRTRSARRRRSKRAEMPLRQFMFRQTRTQDIALFINLAHDKQPQDARGSARPRC